MLLAIAGQLRIGMDLSKITLPVYVTLAPRTARLAQPVLIPFELHWLLSTASFSNLVRCWNALPTFILILNYFTGQFQPFGASPSQLWPLSGPSAVQWPQSPIHEHSYAHVIDTTPC